MVTPDSSVADDLPRLTATVSLDFDEVEGVSSIIKSLDFINVVCRHQTRSNIVLIDHIFRLASQNMVKIGACPSISNDQIQGITSEQLKAFFNFLIGALQGISLEHKHPLSHIKSQGAIYVTTARDSGLADAAVSVISLFSPIATLVGLPGTEHQRAAQTAQVTFLPGESLTLSKSAFSIRFFLRHFFPPPHTYSTSMLALIFQWHVDLDYDEDGVPIIPDEQGSVPDEEVKRRVNNLLNNRLISEDPKVKLPDDVTEVTITVNSGTPEASRIVRTVRELVDAWNSGSGDDAGDV